MDKQWRSSGLFVAGALAGTAVVLTAYLGFFRSPVPVAAPGHPVASAAAPAPAVQATPAQHAAAIASSCPSDSLVAAGSDADGRYKLQPVLGSASHAEPAAFLAVAREAADQGRARDAEVALLAACHVAESASGRQSAPLGDVKSQLGQHYVLLAAREDSEEVRGKLLARAATLFSDSASAYAEALGRNASKTRLAEERLASVHSPDTLRAALHEQRQQNETATLGAARLATPEPTPAPAMVQSDPELAQLEYDLRRLHAQAAAVSRDPGGLERRDAQAIAQRDARCRDKDCMLQWYAQRRAQLLREF